MTNLEKMDAASDLNFKARNKAVKILMYAKTKEDLNEHRALINLSQFICEQADMIDDLLDMVRGLRIENK